MIRKNLWRVFKLCSSRTLHFLNTNESLKLKGEEDNGKVLLSLELYSLWSFIYSLLSIIKRIKYYQIRQTSHMMQDVHREEDARFWMSEGVLVVQDIQLSKWGQRGMPLISTIKKYEPVVFAAVLQWWMLSMWTRGECVEAMNQRCVEMNQSCVLRPLTSTCMVRVEVNERCVEVNQLSLLRVVNYAKPTGNISPYITSVIIQVTQLYAFTDKWDVRIHKGWRGLARVAMCRGRWR